LGGWHRLAPSRSETLAFQREVRRAERVDAR
jgi:hypothetical protein